MVEAAERLRRLGPNRIEKIRGRPAVLRFLANFTHLMAICCGWEGWLLLWPIFRNWRPPSGRSS